MQQIRFKKCSRRWFIKFAKTVDSESLKSNVGKLDIDKFKYVPNNLRNFKSKVYKWDVNKLVSAPNDLGKLSDAVENDVVGKDVYSAKTKILKMKYLILLT